MYKGTVESYHSMEKSFDEKCQEARCPEKDINKGPAGTGSCLKVSLLVTVILGIAFWGEFYLITALN